MNPNRGLSSHGYKPQLLEGAVACGDEQMGRGRGPGFDIHRYSGASPKTSTDGRGWLRRWIGTTEGIRQIGAILHAKAVSATAGRVCD